MKSPGGKNAFNGASRIKMCILRGGSLGDEMKKRL
jgi:hypothetical protein